MILVIDNYDSFTYNLVQYLGELGQELRVVRNDELAPAECLALNPSHIVLSPGPCTPNEAGICCDLVPVVAGRIPILGVCLGHQTIGQVFGARVVRAEQVMHGKTSSIRHDGRGIHAGLPDPFTATRYHSLVLAPDSIPDVLQVCARTDDGVVMAVRHVGYPIFGVQYHPESIMTEGGKRLLMNFLEMKVEEPWGSLSGSTAD